MVLYQCFTNITHIEAKGNTMDILFLGDSESRIIPFLQSKGEHVTTTDQKITAASAQGFDFLISYRYRHILKRDILDLFPNRAINIHNGFLPWNKGADANLWSHVQHTPKGITIHLIDDGIDTGDILVQKEVVFTDADTLATSWKKLWNEAEDLFMECWLKIKNGEIEPKPQTETGTFHYAKDKECIHLTNGWDTLLQSVPSSKHGSFRQ